MVEHKFQVTYENGRQEVIVIKARTQQFAIIELQILVSQTIKSLIICHNQ
jgi:hypothetical protein